MNFDEKGNIFDFLGGKSMMEIANNQKKELEKEYNQISKEMFDLIKNPEVSKFKNLYDRYLLLESKLKEYDCSPRF